MMKYKILALTDHRGHTKDNSLYSILSEFAQDRQTRRVDVASRGVAENDDFFSGINFKDIYVNEVDKHFSYDNAKLTWSTNKVLKHPSNYDIIMMRMPRPITDDFLLGLKANLPDQVFVNDPKGIIECSDKSFLLNFQSLCPPIAISKSIPEIIQKAKEYPIVLKPLREYGGKGLLRINNDILNDGIGDHNTKNYLESIQDFIEQEGFLVMKYLKNVNQGDKRILVVDGEIMAASNRLPAKDSWLCNVAQGGRSVHAEADDIEYKIVKAINPLLRSKGILIYGVDTLVDDDGNRTLSEINALSVGGFPQAERQTGQPIIKKTIQKIFNYASRD